MGYTTTFNYRYPRHNFFVGSQIYRLVKTSMQTNIGIKFDPDKIYWSINESIYNAKKEYVFSSIT